MIESILVLIVVTVLGFFVGAITGNFVAKKIWEAEEAYFKKQRGERDAEHF